MSAHTDANGFTEVQARAVARRLVRGHGARCGLNDGYAVVNEGLSELTQNDVLAIQALLQHAVFMCEKPDHAEIGRIVSNRVLAHALSCADLERAKVDKAEADADRKLEKAA